MFAPCVVRLELLRLLVTPKLAWAPDIRLSTCDFVYLDDRSTAKILLADSVKGSVAVICACFDPNQCCYGRGKGRIVI